ncbi:MAG TPA: transcription-repair coupling factor, partial [Sulfurovum sp.]|nr:transcription-repair coupling factor [Sulfurovum sp.]
MYQSNIYEYLEELQDNKLLICKDDKEATQIRDVAVLLGCDTFVLPDIRVSVGEDLRSYIEDIQLIFTELASYWASKSIVSSPDPKQRKRVMIAPVRALLFPLPKSKYFSMRRLEFGDTVDLSALKDQLYYWGYHFVDIASARGEVSFRGDIIDI